MSGLPGDENPNPQWQRPAQEPSQWQSQWQQQNPQGQPSPPTPTPTPGKAIASLILSIVGLLFCPYVFSVLGLVFGYMARGEIKRAGGGLGGEGLALAGIIIGWGAIAVWTLFFIAVAAL
jgi:hypothetical protein